MYKSLLTLNGILFLVYLGGIGYSLVKRKELGEVVLKAKGERLKIRMHMIFVFSILLPGAQYGLDQMPNIRLIILLCCLIMGLILISEALSKLQFREKGISSCFKNHAFNKMESFEWEAEDRLVIKKAGGKRLKTTYYIKKKDKPTIDEYLSKRIGKEFT
mgnify:CR=1 FL=1